MRIVIGVTGASGSAYAVRLLEELNDQCEVLLVFSEAAKEVLTGELDISFDDVSELASEVIDNKDMAAGICSGSTTFDAMVIVPCTMNTLGKMANGLSDNVITRAASVALKERRPLIIVPRETPLSSIHIENMLKLSREDAIIMPAMPGFYGRPETATEIVDFMVGRILDILGFENELCPRWSP